MMTQSDELADPKTKQVLIVDDDESILSLLTHVVAKEGFKTSTALDGEDALKQIEGRAPDLVILDIMMPSGAEGFQFVWKLRNDPEKAVSRLPILVVSAVHSKTELKLYPDQEDSTYEAGEYLPVQGFLDKPVQPGDLLEHVAKFVK